MYSRRFDYKVITNLNLTTFEELVEMYLRKGYELVGGVYVTSKGDYVQAVMKDEVYKYE